MVEFEKIANGYKSKSSGKLKYNLDSMYSDYLRAKEKSLLDMVSSSLAISTLMHNGVIDLSMVDEKMNYAFELAFPNLNIADVADYTGKSLDGLVNAWKGKYFEVLVADKLNSGEVVGNLFLTDGQIAKIADSPTQPGWDLQVLNDDGSTLDLLQLKATESLDYIQQTIEKYPDIDILTTNNIHSNLDSVFSADISNNELNEIIKAPMEGVFGDSFLDIIPFLPFFIIAVDEYRYVIAGKSTFVEAYPSIIERSFKTGASMGVSYLLFAYLDFGLFSILGGLIFRQILDEYVGSSKNSRIAFEAVVETTEKVDILLSEYNKSSPLLINK